MKITAQIRLYPTTKQKQILQQTTNEYISAVNDIVDYFLGQGKAITMSSKDFNAALPSALKDQVRLDAKSVFRKCKKTHKQHILKKPVAVWNNQNYKIKGQRLCFPVWLNNKTQRISVKASIPKEILDMLAVSKLGTLRISKRNGKYIAQIAYEKTDPITVVSPAAIGVDLGIKCPAVAVSSKGSVQFFGNGRQNKFVRRRFKARRKNLQKKKKLKAVKKLGKKENRWMKNQDHLISRQIVNFAIQEHAGTIKLENLEGIRSTARTSRKNNHSLHSWSFHRLAQYIDYKAKLAGIKVQYVDPRYTSQICPHCGRKHKAKDRLYQCICGYRTHRDIVGARNILAVQGTAACGNSMPACGSI